MQRLYRYPFLIYAALAVFCAAFWSLALDLGLRLIVYLSPLAPGSFWVTVAVCCGLAVATSECWGSR